MSTDLYEGAALYLTRYCGPARDDGGSRVLYQVTISDPENGTAHTVLTPDELRDLAAAVMGEVLAPA